LPVSIPQIETTDAPSSLAGTPSPVLLRLMKAPEQDTLSLKRGEKV
jgi:hypothetical protein